MPLLFFYDIVTRQESCLIFRSFNGERQRAAIGLAILLKPRLLLADEASASLDSKSTVKIVEVLRAISREDGPSVVMVTHDERMLKYCDRIIEIADGDVREKDGDA